MLCIMVLTQKNKSGKLGHQEIGEGTALMLVDKSLNYFSCAKEDAVWWSFKIIDFIGKALRKKQIWIKKKYTLFTGIMRRSKKEKTVYLRIIHSEKNNEDKEKAS